MTAFFIIQFLHFFFILGGRQLKTELEASREKVYAGVTLSRESKVVPSAMGKLCRWTSPRPVMTYATFRDFHQRCEKSLLEITIYCYRQL